MNTMRKIFIMFVCALGIAIDTYATAQDPNVIYIEGERWSLLGELFRNRDLVDRIQKALPRERVKSSANWKGYISFWSIKQNQLYLDSICVEQYDSNLRQSSYESLSQDTMQILFANYTKEKGFKYTAFSGKLRVARGQCVHYVHMGYESNFEYESFLTMTDGQVTGRKDYHNRKQAGFSISNRNDLASLREMFLERVEKYLELKEYDRMVFSLKDVKIDSLGTITDCTVTTPRNDTEFFASEMRQVIMEIKPWETLYLYDELVFPERFGYFFAFPINGEKNN